MQVMPSKFRLSVHRKNEYRKKQNHSVTVQHLSVQYKSPFTSEPVQSTSHVQPIDLEIMKVSIPFAVLWRADVASVVKE